MTSVALRNLEEYKIKASILLKQLRSDVDGRSRPAAERFQQIDYFSAMSVEQIVARKNEVKRKHALAVIALEKGYPNWAALKQKMERLHQVAMAQENGRFPRHYPQRCAGFVNAWYATHEQARDHLDHLGGYLFPFLNDFFVCEREYIETLGLSPDDPDWEKIGWDWAKPADKDAYSRLFDKLRRIES